MTDDLYRPGEEDIDHPDRGEDYPVSEEDFDVEETAFADRVNEAIGADGEPAANLAVAELLAKLAERTNELQGAATELQGVQTALDERTGDLQRLQAEYANYRRRVDRDRVTIADQGRAKVLTELLPVLDDIGRARDHGELEGGFLRVAESLEASLVKLGLEQYGTKGEPFDPNIHEALMHMVSSDVEEDVCAEILQPGYRLGERILRVARVAVAQPADSEQ
ncbi:MAG TPA: nucleotide exchange factor GrpE [Actinocrinis sp.]|nr:nucleotide exchange factor GrpE [Actinocrinis sp.]